MAGLPSSTATRALKKLHASFFRPGADWQQIINFLSQIHENGLKVGEKYYLPDLINRTAEVIEYQGPKNPDDNKVAQFYQQKSRDFLLPADVVSFFWQINDYFQFLNPSASSPAIVELIHKLSSRELVTVNEENEIARILNKEAKKLANEILVNYQQLVNQNLETVESDSNQPVEPENNELPTAGTGRKRLTGGGMILAPETPIEAENDYTLISDETQRTIESLTFLSLQATLRIYDQNLNFNDLPAELRDALYKQLRPKIENLVLGLTADERQSFLEEGNFALRLKILQQAYQYLIATPSSQFLLKTAVEYHFTKYNFGPESLAQAAKAENVNQRLTATAQDMGSWQEINLNFDSSDLKGQLVTKLATLFQQNSGEFITVVENFNHTITALVISNPFLTPQFVDFLSFNQLNTLLNINIPLSVWNNPTSRTNFLQLLRDYWLLYRAELTRNHPEIFVHYQEQSEAELRKATTNTEFNRQLSEVSLVRRLAQYTGNDDQLTLNAYVGTIDEEDQVAEIKACNELFWKQLDENKKQAYLQMAYGAELANLQATLQEEDFEQQVVAKFNYLQYLNATISTEMAAENPHQFQNPSTNSENNGPDFSQNFENCQNEDLTNRLDEAAQLGVNTANKASGALGGLIEKGLLTYLDAHSGGLASQVANFIPEEEREKIRRMLGYAVGIPVLGLGALYGMAKYMQANGGLATSILSTGSKFLFPVLEIPATFLGYAIDKGFGRAFEAAKPSNWWPKAKPPGEISPSSATVPSSASTLATGGTPPPPISTGQSAITPSSLLPKPNLAPTIKHLGFAHPWYQNPFTVSIATTTGTAVLGFGLISTILHSAFLTNFGGTGLYVTPDSTTESKYVTVKKIAQTGCEDNICPEPEFPMEVTYEITIQPKDQYSITITGISDELKVLHNQEKYAELGKAVPTIPIQTKTLADFNLTNDQLIIEPTEEPLTLTYTITLTSDYNHALIRNRFKLSFNHLSPNAGSGTDEIVAVETIRLGDYPEGHICWPSSGSITQQPYTTYAECQTHKTLDAYDLSANEGTPIYAPIDGLLCAGNHGAGYGVHVTLTGTIDGESYEFIFGHLKTGSPLVVGTSCITVGEGEIIGEVDNTGNSTGNHLHFELRASSVHTYTLNDLLTDGEYDGYFPLEYVAKSCYE